MKTKPPISGRRVAGHRVRLGITQKQLADMLGIGLSTLQGIENNRRAPSLLTAIDLAEILTEDKISLLRHDGLDDEGEFASARFWKPDAPVDDQARPLDRVRAPELPVAIQRRGDEVRPTLPTLRRVVRTNPGGA